MRRKRFSDPSKGVEFGRKPIKRSLDRTPMGMIIIAEVESRGKKLEPLS